VIEIARAVCEAGYTRTMAAINWFPGHMNKTQQTLAELMPQVQVVIEVLDARLPYSSANPLLDELRRNVVGAGGNGAHGDVPCITVLSKVDLADPKLTREWQQVLHDHRGVKTLAMNLTDLKEIKRLPKLIRRIGEPRAGRMGEVHVAVVGIPNVGKSTLINGLRGKKVAKTGDEPAVTKGKQMINLKNGIILMDTPGILWPKFEDQVVGYRLATSGAIKDTAVEYFEIASFAAEWLTREYPAALIERYKLKELPEEPLALFDAIGRKRGCLVAGGEVEINRAAEILLRDLRSGKLGRLTYEKPKEMVWDEVGQAEPHEDSV